MARTELGWESKLVLLLVLPAAATDVAFKTTWWTAQPGGVAVWVLGLSALLGLITWRIRAATPGAAATGAIITASLMFSTLKAPYGPLHTALVPVLAVSLLAFASTRVGRASKERLGTAERHNGRTAAQIAANLGLAALAASEFAKSGIADGAWLRYLGLEKSALFTVALAALAEAAADTASSEIGQVWGGRPRMLTTFRTAEPGTDGAISRAGTMAGIAASALVAALGAFALGGDLRMFGVACAGGVFGLLFDSLLGATAERLGWLNNDAVNFLSTGSAAGFAIGLLAFLR